MDSLTKIRETAAQWMAKRIGQDWTEEQQAELDQWLEASTSHRVEFLRLASLWRQSERLRVLGAGVEPGKIPTLEDWRTSPFFKHVPKGDLGASVGVPAERKPPLERKGKYYAVAAGVVVAAILASWIARPLRGDAEYSTPVGGRATIPLADGSKVTLNTASEIRAAVTARERRVSLGQGEAFFDVAKDTSRPFTVFAGKERITAIGTQFSVRRDGDDVRVVVTEGKVRVDSGAQPVILSAGEISSTHAESTALLEKPLALAQELLSWRSGYLVFHETTLTDAVAEFNRYNSRKILVRDPELAHLHVSGNFRANNLDSFARLLEQGFPVVVSRDGEDIVLTRR